MEVTTQQKEFSSITLEVKIESLRELYELKSDLENGYSKELYYKLVDIIKEYEK